MAMTVCPECNHEISTKAKRCVSCGAKNQRHIGFSDFIWLIICIIGLWYIIPDLYNKLETKFRTGLFPSELAAKEAAERTTESNRDSASQSTQEPTPSAEIVSFSGSGIRNTKPFTTNGPWEIQWDAKGEVFQIYLYTADGELVNIAASQGAGTGSSYQPNAGKYYLQINAMGHWKVHVVTAD